MDIEHVEYIQMKAGFRLAPLCSGLNNMLSHVLESYDYSDFRESDIVLDIGANVGIFSLLVYKRVSKVYAVEPMYGKELSLNIGVNDAEDVIQVIPYALGNGMVNCSYARRKAAVCGKSLTELKQLCGGHVDVLKCDCEGGEWNIKPEELKGFRRIEMEVHCRHGEDPGEFPRVLRSLGYTVVVNVLSARLLLIHAFMH